MDAAHRLVLIFILAACMMVAACGPEPTPLPVVVPTSTPVPETANTSVSSTPNNVLHYLVDPLAAEVIAASGSDSIALAIQIVETPRLTGNPSEIVISSQSFEGSQPLSTPFFFGLALDMESSLQEFSEVTTVMLEYFRLLAAEQREDERLAEARRLTRESIANAGYPDGIRIRISNAIPSLVQDFASAGIDIVESNHQPEIQVVFGDAQRDAAEQAYGEGNVIYGFELPLYYAASPDLQIALGSDGLPVLASNP